MIKVADKPLIKDLQGLTRNGDNEYVKQKAERVLNVILNSRHDLK